MGIGFGDALILFFPIIFYIAPLIFVIWFLIKFLKVQKEKNEVLRAIAEKKDKQND